jgi:uncharacterized glyoxalase superfamily protein PhnB
MAALVRSRYVIAVPDLARSAAFYGQALGFSVLEMGHPGWRWFERDACAILAGECADAIPAADLGDHSYFAYIEVTDADALHAEFTGRGVELIKPLRDEPWGMREFGIRTIDGHRLMFGARPGGVRAEQAVPILPGDDLDAARAFYIGALGFSVRFESSEDGRNGLLGLERGTIRLTIDCPMAGHGREACVSLEVDDADRYYLEWRRRAAIRRPPEDQPWGGRTFDLLDPFGNTIFVIGPALRDDRPAGGQRTLASPTEHARDDRHVG